MCFLQPACSHCREAKIRDQKFHIIRSCGLKIDDSRNHISASVKLSFSFSFSEVVLGFLCEDNRGAGCPNTDTDFTPVSFLVTGTRFKLSYVIREVSSHLRRAS